MSAWSSYYQAVSGAGRLSRLIKETKQRQILLDAVTNEIPDPEQLSISRSWASLSGLSDKLSGGISRQVNDLWKLPLEPYHNMRLWLKFDSGLQCKDWSYRGNKTHLKSKSIRMPAKNLLRDDGITESQVYNIFDGENQWAEVENSSAVSFSEILMEEDEVTLTVFFSPFGVQTLDSDGYSDLFYKIDSDEVKYAYRARIRSDGALKFTVVDNYAVYDLETAAGVVPQYDTGDFDVEDFEGSDFISANETPHQIDATLTPTDWTIYTFTYNTVTKSMKICSAWVDIDNVANKSVVVEAQTTNPLNLTDTSVYYPAKEGNGTVLHDSSGNNRNSNFSSSPNNTTWDASTHYLTFSGDTDRILISAATALNAFTSFTFAFKVRLSTRSTTSAADYIFSKGNSGNGGAVTAIGGFKAYNVGSGSQSFAFSFKPDSNPATQTITVPNAFAALNTWYDVIITYDGTTYTVRFGNLTPVTLARSGDVFTNSDFWTIGDTSSSFQGNLSDFIIVKNRVWGTADRAWFTSVAAGFKGGLPVWQPLPPPEPVDPVPITRPITKIYDVPQPASPQEYKLNNPAATTPFAEFYNVPGGTPTTDPELLKYSVADGTSTGGTAPIDPAFYSLTGQNSQADLVAGEDGYGQYIRASGSVINGKRIGRITIAGLKRNSSGGGTVTVGIIKANGQFVAFGASISVSSLSTSDWTSFTRDNAANAHPTTGYACAVGDGVGIQWTGGSGTIYIQRAGSGGHFESNTLSCQATFDDGEWNITNDSYSMAGAFHTGGYSTSVPAEHNMNNTSESSHCPIGMWQTNAVGIEGIVPTRIIWRVKRVGTLNSASLKCFMVNGSNVSQVVYGASIPCSGIGTASFQDIEFIKRDSTIAWADGFRIVLQYDVNTGVNSSNYIVANYFPGGQVAGTAVKAQKYRGIGGWADVGTSGTDWAGKVYTGGNDFNPWVALNDTRKRYGEKVASNTPAPNAKGMARKITKATFTLRKVGDPVDTITFKIYSGLTAMAQSFNQINAASISTSETSYDFTWVFNNYTTQLNDYLVIEYNSGTAANYIEVKINTDAAAGAAGDGQKMIAVEFVNGAWVNITNMDVAAVMYEGGIPDLSSRNRVAIMVVTEASALKSDKVTEASFYFKIEGTVTGSIEIRSRRGSDDTPRDLLGTIPVSGLNNTTWQKKTVILRTAVHFLGVSDKITIEYNGGNQTNYVRVMMNPEDIFDGDDTQISEFNSVTWSSPVDNLEIVGELWTGGDTYTPPPGTPWIPPPLAYNHNLFICAGGGLSDGNTGVPITYSGMRIRDMRIVAGDPNYALLTSLENWILNRHTILPILKGQVALCAYTTARSESA